jgi:integrase
VLLNGALGWAVRNELVGRNVAKAIEPPTIPRSTAVALSASEAQVILSAAEATRWGPFMHLAIIVGMRRGELVGLRWSDIDFEAGTVTVACSLSQTRAHGVQEKSTKTDRVRPIDDLSPKTLDALRRQRSAQNAERLAAGERYRDSGHVFQEPLGGPIAPDKATGAFRRLARRNGVATTSLHALRHTAGSWMVGDGADPRTVAHVLGHASPSITMSIYAHVMPGKQKQRCSGRTTGSPLWRVRLYPKGYRRPTRSQKTLIP